MNTATTSAAYQRLSRFRISLGLLGGEEVQTLVKFVKLPSLTPSPLWGEGGPPDGGPGEG